MDNYWMIGFIVFHIMSCKDPYTPPIFVNESSVPLEIITNDEEVRDVFLYMVERFNLEIGYHAITPTITEKNSTAELEEGLTESHGSAIALGQWESISTNDGGTRKIYHGMKLRFDLDFFHKKITEQDWEYLYRLFTHEFGHGLKLEHDPSDKSVMYSLIPEINNDVDYSDFYKKISNFLDQDYIIIDQRKRADSERMKKADFISSFALNKATDKHHCEDPELSIINYELYDGWWYGFIRGCQTEQHFKCKENWTKCESMDSISVNYIEPEKTYFPPQDWLNCPWKHQCPWIERI